MRVDLYTDASVKDGVATWATVALIPDQPPSEHSGWLRADTNCSTTAELRAIANALHWLIQRGDVRRGDEVVVRTDSRFAVERIERRLTRRPNSGMGKATLVIHKLSEVHGITLTALWIRGHQSADSSPHARWNNRCDALCKAARTLPRPSPARKALDAGRRLAGTRA